MPKISMLCLKNNFTNITGFVSTVAEYQHCPINRHNRKHYPNSDVRHAIPNEKPAIFSSVLAYDHTAGSCTLASSKIALHSSRFCD